MLWHLPRKIDDPAEGSLVLTISYALDKVREGSHDDELHAALANRIVRKALDKGAIRYKDYRLWRQKNPLIFTTVVDDEDQLLGFFDIFPLTAKAGEEVISGQLSERSLTIEHLLPLNSISSATHIHIATIIVNPRQRSFSPLVVRELLLLKMAEFIEDHYFPIETRTFTAYGQSKAGEALLRRSGFSVALLATDNEQRCPLYVLRPGEAETAVLRFERAENGLSAMRRGRIELKELDQRIEAIELQLRSIITSVLGPDRARLPPHVNQKAEERVRSAAKKSGIIDVARYSVLPQILEFCDLRELADIITSKPLWPEFQSLFSNKETFVSKFDQVSELRNGIRHSRAVDEIAQKEGEAGILWFERLLRQPSPPDRHAVTLPPVPSALGPRKDRKD
jgi:hypothetical protein